MILRSSLPSQKFAWIACPSVGPQEALSIIIRIPIFTPHQIIFSPNSVKHLITQISLNLQEACSTEMYISNSIVVVVSALVEGRVACIYSGMFLVFFGSWAARMYQWISSDFTNST